MRWSEIPAILVVPPGSICILKLGKTALGPIPDLIYRLKPFRARQDNKGNINVGSGSWLWPIEDFVRLTQFYGHTPYSWRYSYSGEIHTGYDMVSTSSDVIRAPADGTLFKSSQMCGPNNINVVYIEHGDNLVSLYFMSNK